MKCGKLNFYLFSLHVVDSPAHPYEHTQKDSNQYHTIIRAALVCVFVPYLLRGPLTDLRQTWWVYVGGPRNCP